MTMQLLHDLKAEVVLSGTNILGQLTNLKTSLTYKTDTESYQFEDYFNLLNKEIQAIDRIELLASIPPGGSQSYLIDLAQSLQVVTDKIEVAQTKAIYFLGKLKSAKHLSDNLLATFSAWYQIAITEKLIEAKVKLPASALKALAESEFSRLIDSVDLNIDGLIAAVEVVTVHLKEMRKIAQEKYKLGSDQANAAIVNLPFNGIKEASAQVFPLLQQRWKMTPDTPTASDTFDDEEEESRGEHFEEGPTDLDFEDIEPSYVNKRESDKVELPTTGIHKTVESPVVVNVVADGVSEAEISKFIAISEKWPSQVDEEPSFEEEEEVVGIDTPEVAAEEVVEKPKATPVVIKDDFAGVVSIADGKPTRIPLAKRKITFSDDDGDDVVEPVVERPAKESKPSASKPMPEPKLEPKPVKKPKIVFDEDEDDEVPF